MDPACRPPDLDQFITDFSERVPGVVSALVVSADGVPMAASDRIQPNDLQKLSAIAAGLTALAAATVPIFDGDDVIQALVVMERGTFVIMAIDDGSSLAVLTTTEADLEQVAYEMTILAEQAGRLFTPAVRGAGGSG